MSENLIFRLCQESDYPWIIAVHDRHYRLEEGFDDTFKDAVVQAIEKFQGSYEPINRGIVAELDGQSVGCIFCVHEGPETARLKLFFLDKRQRGKGNGAALLAVAINHVKDQGYKNMVVSTYSAHMAACALYRKIGFELVEEKVVSAYSRELVEQTYLLSCIDADD